jgi:hypothetical protein
MKEKNLIVFSALLLLAVVLGTGAFLNSKMDKMQHDLTSVYGRIKYIDGDQKSYGQGLAQLIYFCADGADSRCTKVAKDLQENLKLFPGQTFPN